MAKRKRRLGIFAGSFDPIHAGHLAFALQAIKDARLDQVYFLPERQPRHKPNVEHFGHRTAMITRAIRPHKKLGLLELPDIYFDVKRTLPKLQKEFAGAKLVFLMGSDTAAHLDDWPAVSQLTRSANLVIGVRADDDRALIASRLRALPGQSAKSVHIIESPADHVSSSRIRQAFRHNLPAAGLLASVRRYARANWLYISLAGE